MADGFAETLRQIARIKAKMADGFAETLGRLC
jgi:hypothetical protein